MFKKHIDDLKNDLISSTCKLIQIPSVFANFDDPKMPFGKDVNTALEYMLDLGTKLGFRTKNIDGYCGYIEFGEGEDLLRYYRSS